MVTTEGLVVFLFWPVNLYGQYGWVCQCLGQNPCGGCRLTGRIFCDEARSPNLEKSLYIQREGMPAVWKEIFPIGRKFQFRRVTTSAVNEVGFRRSLNIFKYEYKNWVDWWCNHIALSTCYLCCCSSTRWGEEAHDAAESVYVSRTMPSFGDLCET